VPIQDTGLAAPTLPGQNAGQPWVVNLDPSQDYILEIRHRHTGPIEGLSINGGHNVVIIGGEITDDLALAPDSTAEYRQGGLIFHNQTGVVHLEGVLFDGNPLQALIFDSAQATFQVENCRIQGVYMWNENFSTPHSDALVTWNSPPEIRFDKLTADYDNTGVALYSGLSTPGVFPGHVTFKRTNLRNSSTPYGFEALYRQGNTTRLDIDQMYVETGWGRGSTTQDFPPLGLVHVTLNGGIALGGDPTYNGNFRSMTLTGDGVSQGSYVDFANPSLDNVWGAAGAPARIYYGVPSAGDFVPAGVAGANYVSPGYQ